jgi:hypothetical protein
VRRPLQNTLLGHGEGLAWPHDDVVQHFHIDHGQSRFQHLGEVQVSGAGVDRPTGMVVRQHHRGTVMVKRAQHHLARVDAGLTQGAPKLSL